MTTLSFIIPAHNEERLLGGAMDSIHAAMRNIDLDYEIIVADDASTDRTAAIARERGATVVSVEHRQISRTRNSGAAAARGRVLFFIDADTVIDEAVLRGALRALNNGAIGGGVMVRFDSRLPWWAAMILPLAPAGMRLVRMAAGCFIFCTRDAFDAVGGFCETMYAAEEVVFSWRLGRQGRFVLLQESVVTSARKLRTHAASEIAGVALLLLARGPRVLQQREGLELWYGSRRDDQPIASAASTAGSSGEVMPLRAEEDHADEC